MRNAIVIFIAVFFAVSARAGESYTAKTLSFDFVETKTGPVRVLWEGEIANDTVNSATLCAVVVLLDDKGRVLHEMESAAVNVKRFGSCKRSEVFAVDPELWAKADSLDQRAQWSSKDPVNGRRIRQVELYTTSWCPYCTKAREYLISKGIQFTEYDVEEDPAAARRKEEFNPDGGVPTAVIDGKVVVGFSEATYRKVLK